MTFPPEPKPPFVDFQMAFSKVCSSFTTGEAPDKKLWMTLLEETYSSGAQRQCQDTISSSILTRSCRDVDKTHHQAVRIGSKHPPKTQTICTDKALTTQAGLFWYPLPRVALNPGQGRVTIEKLLPVRRSCQQAGVFWEQREAPCWKCGSKVVWGFSAARNTPWYRRWRLFLVSPTVFKSPYYSCEVTCNSALTEVSCFASLDCSLDNRSSSTSLRNGLCDSSI